MNQKSKLIIIIAVFGFNIFLLQGQETIATSGGNFTGSGGSVSYTVGQVTFSTFYGTNGSVVQGVQQPYEISVITAVENTEEIKVNCIVYPNPTKNTIKLSIESPDFDNMSYRLFDINGKLIQEMKVESEKTEISMHNLVPSIYFLRVIKNRKELKTFKIIKN
jgi:Secretion system C-terminal sorting domain